MTERRAPVVSPPVCHASLETRVCPGPGRHGAEGTAELTHLFRWLATVSSVPQQYACINGIGKKAGIINSKENIFQCPIQDGKYIYYILCTHQVRHQFRTDNWQCEA